MIVEEDERKRNGAQGLNEGLGLIKINEDPWFSPIYRV